MKKTILTRLSEQKFVSVLHVPKHSESGGGRGHFEALDLCLFPEFLVFNGKYRATQKHLVSGKNGEKNYFFFFISFCFFKPINGIFVRRDIILSQQGH